MLIVCMTLCWSLSNCSGRMLWWRTWLYLTVIQIWEVVGQCKFLKLDELEENEQMNTFLICVVVLTESHSSFIFKICSTEPWIFLSVYLEDPPTPPHSGMTQWENVMGGEGGQGLLGFLVSYIHFNHSGLALNIGPLLMTLFKQSTPWLKHGHCNRGCG